jgi:hypothetical protein
MGLGIAFLMLLDVDEVCRGFPMNDHAAVEVEVEALPPDSRTSSSL